VLASPLHSPTLPASTLFEGLSPDEVDTIRQAAQRRSIARGAFLFHQGDPAANAYVLLLGRARLSQVTVDGQEVLVQFIGAGDPAGLVAAFPRATYPLSAQAVEDCVALVWDGETLAQLMARFPRLALNGMGTVSGRMRDLQDRVRELQTERVERRIARALLRLVRQVGRKTDQGVVIDMSLSRQDIAEMTGATLYTVSRVLSGWESDGVVASGRERVTVLAPHRLVTIAEDLPAAN
jgi:CRP/FNR family transcriptional regulator, nitrogen oxide reductase regulator